jgi:hypothetical protein
VAPARGAGLKSYITGIELMANTLATATELEIREADVAAGSQTISSNILTTGTHSWKIGDAVIPTASGVTGLTANVQVFVLTVPSATTVTFSATPGGATLAISGTAVTATLHRVLRRHKIETTGILPAYNRELSIPLMGGINIPMYIQGLTTFATGNVYCNLTGFIAP